MSTYTSVRFLTILAIAAFSSVVLLALMSLVERGTPDDWPRTAVALSAAAVALLSYVSERLEGRARALKEIFALLPANCPGKHFLFDPGVGSNTVLSPLDRRSVLGLAVRLDRAAALAAREGATGDLLERYWDWYFFLNHRFKQVLLDEQQRKRREVETALGVAPGHLPGTDINRVWLLHLHELHSKAEEYARRYIL